jgi:predicted RNA-binding Zn-ribbon protein involved in translation (DUF1610 family)
MKGRQLVKRICPTCKELFIPKSDKNIYCNRRCFKKDYHMRKKAEELTRVKYPSFNCPSCGQNIVLDFDPASDTLKWAKYICHGCNTLLISVSEDIIINDPLVI